MTQMKENKLSDLSLDFSLKTLKVVFCLLVW